MNLMHLVEAIRAGRWLEMRQWLNDESRNATLLSSCPEPDVSHSPEVRGLAAALAELLAQRWQVPAPSWTSAIGAVPGELWLAPFAQRHASMADRCRTHGPEPLRRRRIWAMPDFLVTV